MKVIRNRGYESLFPRCEPQGDSALLVRFGDKIDPELNQRVHSLFQALEEDSINGCLESIPAYCTLLVNYDPLKLNYYETEKWVKTTLSRLKSLPPHTPTIHEVPVIYGGEHGLDLEEVARLHNLSQDEVVRLHSSELYKVYFVGFLPGFPYLGGLNPALETPRLETPRLIVKAGSVGIAGTQTGIYPLDSPGGWRIIGWTPMTLFDPSLEPPSRFSPGDAIRFISQRDGGIIP